MNRHEIRLSDVIGRVVRDVDGRSIGRLEEMRAEIELHARVNDYVVVEFHVGAYGALEALTGARFARQVLRRLGTLVRYRVHRVPWTVMDLSDASRPRITCRAAELPPECG
ncbi:MAG: PRC-barrel domain containing protein [Gemmatimonadota bacterium]|nr:PRC-barrel domain containing protein [Gemmatimonadota bacterium]